MQLIHEHWMALAGNYTSDREVIGELFVEILDAYADKSRHYHGLSHVKALLTLSEQFQKQLQHPHVVDFAIFYHDIVYRSSRQDNEEKSARVAHKRLTQIQFPPEHAQAVVDFILATKSHTIVPSVYEKDLAWFLDFDLSILGADEPMYFDYVNNIRKEFKIYPDLLYKPGRRKVLQHFLDKEFIFKTEEFRTTYEHAARRNINKELESL